MAVKNNHMCECTKCEEYREALEKVHNWLVCHPIATAEDMAQSFPAMEEAVRGALE